MTKNQSLKTSTSGSSMPGKIWTPLSLSKSPRNTASRTRSMAPKITSYTKNSYRNRVSAETNDACYTYLYPNRTEKEFD